MLTTLIRLLHARYGQRVDVLTTGATLQAVALALKEAGAAHVEGWVLARAVDRRREPPRGRVLQ